MLAYFTINALLIKTVAKVTIHFEFVGDSSIFADNWRVLWWLDYFNSIILIK